MYILLTKMIDMAITSQKQRIAEFFEITAGLVKYIP